MIDFEGILKTAKTEDKPYDSSGLAKLMATENLTVLVSDVRTASWDSINRVLRMPNWINIPKECIDMFTAHECSHALHSPGIDIKTMTNPSLETNSIRMCEEIRVDRLIKQNFQDVNVIMRLALIIW